jgi:malto-oligosyltrehalose trehalohydrolase
LLDSIFQSQPGVNDDDNGMKHRHSMRFGAELMPDGQIRFRLWAPTAKQVDVHLMVEDRYLPMVGSTEGWFELITSQAVPGSRYKFQIERKTEVPDPASRFQPEDVYGPSEVVDPLSFEWDQEPWRNRPWEHAVLYEIHVGAFSRAGTFAGVEERLGYLADLGITAVELMPVADFPGARNWGYDGVLPFAPDSRYGRPNDLKRLVQTAHRLGLMVLLDVVYNHFGPEGNFLREYAPQFFTDRYRTPWGEAINFDGPDSQNVREFFIQNALYWLEEYRFDGLRVDGAHQIFDRSPCHFLTELAGTVRSALGPNRLAHLILENDKNESHFLKEQPSRVGGFYNAQWNDDFHHALHVTLTSECDGYYRDYADRPVPLLARCLAEGFAFQGEFSPFHGKNRGEDSRNLPPSAFVCFLQNHDQVGNRAFGERMVSLANPQAIEAALAIQLLAPSPPLLFMGEEFGAQSPFLFFCDFPPALAQAIARGRREEFSRFEKFADREVQALIPDPNAEETFLQSKLDWESLLEARSKRCLEVYRELLGLRHYYVTPMIAEIKTRTFRTFGERSLQVSWHTRGGSALELLANLSGELISCADQPGRKPFYSTDVGRCPNGYLGPWSVQWFFKS